MRNTPVDNLEAIFARYNQLEANDEGCSQEYDVLSHEAVEMLLRHRTVDVRALLDGELLVSW